MAERTVMEKSLSGNKILEVTGNCPLESALESGGSDDLIWNKEGGSSQIKQESRTGT